MNDTAKMLAQRVENEILVDHEPDTLIELDDVYNAVYTVIKDWEMNDGDERF